MIEGEDRQGTALGLGLRGRHGQRVGQGFQEQESNGGESASKTLSGGAGSMRWDGLATDSKSSSACWVRNHVLRVRR